MKAIRIRQFGGPDVLTLEEIDKPHAGPGEILVRIKAAGINPVDTYIAAGTYAQKPNLPYTPGMDGAGLVEAIGPQVTQFQIGDRVYVESARSGTYAEFSIVDQNHLHLLPVSFTFQQGAALGVPYATAYEALFFRSHAQRGESILIHGGSGSVGVAAIELSKALGLKIIATAGSEKGLRLIQQLGVDHALSHQDPTYLQQLAALTGNKGVDIILEMAAHINLGKDLSLLAPHGRVVVIGSRGSVEINPRDLMGCNGEIMGLSYLKTTTEKNNQIHQHLAGYLNRKEINPIIRQELPLKEAAQGHQDIRLPGSHGKIVLIP